MGIFKMRSQQSWNDLRLCLYSRHIKSIYSGNTVHVIEPGGIKIVNYLYSVFTFIAWIILFILCWPLAILALVLYPVFWILSLPFRLLGIAVDGVFGLLKSLIMLPGRVLQR